MSTQFPDARAHWFHLSDDAWDEIGRAYCAGATAKELAQHWKVSPTTIYRKAREKGWSKKRNADDIVRAAQAQTAPPPSGATYFRLDEAAWVEIGEAYRNGATAEALGARWQVSAGTILRQARLRAWSPKHAKPRGRVAHTVDVAASAAVPEAEVLPPEGMFAPDPRFHLERYTGRELFDPGMISQIAASASGGAMLVGAYQDSLVLAQIAYAHARLVKMRPASIREIVWEALSSRAGCDDLFSHTRSDGEEDLKKAYWKMRTGEDKRQSELRAELRDARARIAELEAALATRGEAPPGGTV